MVELENSTNCIDGTQAHYWEIEPSKGHISMGTCNKCKQVKKFTNSMNKVVNWRIAGKEGYKMAGGNKDNE